MVAEDVNFREVLFRDVSTGDEFIIGSTVETDATDTLDGEEFPLVEVEVSSGSHPFYTGQQNLVDAEGRVEKFQRKYGEYEGNADGEDEDESA